MAPRSASRNSEAARFSVLGLRNSSFREKTEEVPYATRRILVLPMTRRASKKIRGLTLPPTRFDVSACVTSLAGVEAQWSNSRQLFSKHVTEGLPVLGRRRQRASKSGLSMFGLLDYRGWPRRRLHSPRAERMKVKPPSPPSAQSVQTKKKPPVDLAISP